MKMYIAMIAVAVLAGSMLATYAEDTPAVPAAAEKQAPAPQSVYVCPDCHTVAMAAGKCTGCQKDLVESHILAVNGSEASVCGCHAGCKCDAKSMKEGKCGCGKDVGKVSLKGMYVCPSGCPMISDKAGNCGGCGKEMKKVE